MIVLNEIAGFVLPFFIFSFSDGKAFQRGCASRDARREVPDGDTDGAVGFGKLGEATGGRCWVKTGQRSSYGVPVSGGGE